MSNLKLRGACLLIAAILVTPRAAEAATFVVVDVGGATLFIEPLEDLPNSGDPTGWIANGYDTSQDDGKGDNKGSQTGNWQAGIHGVGYGDGDDATLIEDDNSIFSVYTRSEFNVADASIILSMTFEVDYDDSYIAWLNGVEISRSSTAPSTPTWNADAGNHGSSENGTLEPPIDLSAFTSALVTGTNVLAIGVWNQAPTSSDMTLLPRLTLSDEPIALSVTRSPYLMLGTPTSVTVRWRTSIPADSAVRYGTSLGTLNEMVSSGTETTEHIVPITGLLPNTKYYYSVGTASETLEGDASDYYIQTTKGPGEPIRIWAIGDFGTGTAPQFDVRDSYYEFTGSTHTDVWLQLGDNAYPNGTDSEYQAKNFSVYDELYRKTVTWPTLGNHDGQSADSSSETGVYYDIFTLPRAAEAGGLASGTEAYYSFDYGNVHFVCLDSYDTNRSTGGAMLTWLENDLAATAQDWIIAFWHHPPYTKGSHNSDTEIEHMEMRANALPILEDYGVDLTLGGHSHVYERTFLIAGHYGLSTTWEAATHLLDGGDGRTDGDGAYAKGAAKAPQDGAVHITAGSGGQLSSSFGLDHPAHFYAALNWGSVVIDVDGGQMDVKFLRETGAVDDYFTLTKAVMPPGPGPTATITRDQVVDWAFTNGSGSWTVEFNDDVLNVDDADFSLDLSLGNAVASGPTVTGAGASYTASISGVSGTGTIILNFDPIDVVAVVGGEAAEPASGVSQWFSNVVPAPAAMGWVLVFLAVVLALAAAVMLRRKGLKH